MQTKFKKGDKVFDYAYGWGEVEEILEHYQYSVCVVFKGDVQRYSFDGRRFDSHKPTLSFTEYALQGFSQERPVELPEIDVKVKTDVGTWNYFKRFVNFVQ